MDKETALADCRYAAQYALELEKLLAQPDPDNAVEADRVRAALVVYSDRLLALAECIRVVAKKRGRQLRP